MESTGHTAYEREWNELIRFPRLKRRSSDYLLGPPRRETTHMVGYKVQTPSLRRPSSPQPGGGTAPLAQPGSENREPSTALHARLDRVRGVRSTHARAKTTKHMWPQQMCHILSSAGAEVMLAHLMEYLSPKFYVCNNRREKGIPNIPARLAGGT